MDRDGRFKNAVGLELADDGSAIEAAKRLAANSHTVELWDGKRRVGAFKNGE